MCIVAVLSSAWCIRTAENWINFLCIVAGTPACLVGPIIWNAALEQKLFMLVLMLFTETAVHKFCTTGMSFWFSPRYMDWHGKIYRLYSTIYLRLSNKVKYDSSFYEFSSIDSLLQPEERQLQEMCTSFLFCFGWRLVIKLFNSLCLCKKL